MKIDFEVTQNGYTFRDAIHLPDDHAFTDVEIEQMKQARFDAWYITITTPVEPSETEQLPQE